MTDPDVTPEVMSDVISSNDGLRYQDVAAADGGSGAGSQRDGFAVGWDRFWFGEISGAVVALFRTLLGLVNLYWFVTLIPDLNWFFGDESVDPTVPYVNGRWGLFAFLDAELLIWPVVILSIVASLALITGRAVLPASIWLAVAVMSLYNGNVYLWNSGDDLLRIINVLFSIGALVVGSAAVSVRLFPDDLTWPAVPALPMRLAQVQLTAIYLTTVFDKIPGSTWRDGTAIGSALKIENLARFPIPEFVTENALVVNVLTWASLGLEVALPFLLWNRSTRRFAIIAGVALHAGIEYALFVGVFSWSMFVLYSSFLDGAGLERFLRRVSGRFTRR